MAVLAQLSQRDPNHEEEASNCSEDPPAVFVYRSNGGVDKYENAVLVLRSTKLLVFKADRIVATYDRAKVFFATRTPIAPPILF